MPLSVAISAKSLLLEAISARGIYPKEMYSISKKEANWTHNVNFQSKKKLTYRPNGKMD